MLLEINSKIKPDTSHLDWGPFYDTDDVMSKLEDVEYELGEVKTELYNIQIELNNIQIKLLLK